jgi:hypothetical protein
MPEPEILPPKQDGPSGLVQLGQRLRDAWRRPRWRVALIIAAVSDAVAYGTEPLLPLQWGLDLITAVALFAAIGFRWPLLPALAIEVVPGLGLFPAWTLAVGALAAMDSPVDEAPRG